MHGVEIDEGRGGGGRGAGGNVIYTPRFSLETGGAGAGAGGGTSVETCATRGRRTPRSAPRAADRCAVRGARWLWRWRCWRWVVGEGVVWSLDLPWAGGNSPPRARPFSVSLSASLRKSVGVFYPLNGVRLSNRVSEFRSAI